MLINERLLINNEHNIIHYDQCKPDETRKYLYTLATRHLTTYQSSTNFLSTSLPQLIIGSKLVFV